MNVYEPYIQFGLFALMYLFGLYLLQSVKKVYPVVIYTLAYFFWSYAGYLVNGKNGLVIGVEAVLVGAVLYWHYQIKKRIDAALKRIEEKERAAQASLLEHNKSKNALV